MTPELLAACTDARVDRAARFAEPLTEAMQIFDISTPARQAAFLAQVAHETSRLKFTTELWGPTAAQKGYEGREDLGNTQPGDGSRYRGHGLIQTTGRANHAAARDRLRARSIECPDFEAEPEKLAEPRWAALSAGDFWDMKRLNALADVGAFETITRRINGGTNGQADRLVLWDGAKLALGVA